MRNAALEGRGIAGPQVDDRVAELERATPGDHDQAFLAGMAEQLASRVLAWIHADFHDFQLALHRRAQQLVARP